MLIALIGFWPSYFSYLLGSNIHVSYYMHFHAFVALLWISILIIQPILIKKKYHSSHRFVGKISYFIVPLFYISVILLAHSRLYEIEETDIWRGLWIVLKDLFIFGVSYFIAIINKRKMNIHARGMIVTGLVFIEPSLVRFMKYVFFPSNSLIAYWSTIIIIYSILIVLIFIERNKKEGKWVFPLTLGLYIFFHSVFIFQIEIESWLKFSKWFNSLPLT